MDIEGDCPTCVKYLIKAGNKAWKTVSRQTYLNYVKNGGWGKVVTRKNDVSRNIAKNDSKKIFGKESVEHTQHTRSVNSKKTTKPHYQPPGDGDGKIFYQATPLFILNEKGIDKSVLYSIGEFVLEMTIDFITLGGSNVAHAPTNNFGLYQSPQTLSKIFSNTLNSIGKDDVNDIDGDGISDYKDFVCNGCGPEKSNVVPIKNYRDELYWEQLNDDEAIKYQNDDNYRNKKFNESYTELNETQ